MNAVITFGHYRELVTPDEAKRFWEIVPAVQGRIIRALA
jgi:hypothetical protein